MVKRDTKTIGIIVAAAAGLGGLIYYLTRRAKAVPPSGGAILYGVVTDTDTSLPIEGVKVSLDGLATYTDSGGVYTFDGVAPGAYTVEFSKEGYETLVY